jgi:hypothetical protein
MMQVNSASRGSRWWGVFLFCFITSGRGRCLADARHDLRAGSNGTDNVLPQNMAAVCTVGCWLDGQDLLDLPPYGPFYIGIDNLNLVIILLIMFTNNLKYVTKK